MSNEDISLRAVSASTTTTLDQEYSNNPNLIGQVPKTRPKSAEHQFFLTGDFLMRKSEKLNSFFHVFCFFRPGGPRHLAVADGADVVPSGGDEDQV